MVDNDILTEIYDKCKDAFWDKYHEIAPKKWVLEHSKYIEELEKEVNERWI